MVEAFKKKHPNFEDRVQQSGKIRTQYPDRIPIICEKSTSSKLPDIDKNKYLVPADLTAYKFSYIIRKRIKMPEKDALYFFV